MTQAPEDLDPRVARTRDAVSTAVRTLVQRDGVEAITHQRVAEPELRELEQQLLAHGTAGLRRSLQQAVDRGELPDDLRIDDAVARLAGPVFYRRMLAHGPIDDAFVEAVVSSFVPAPRRS
jgi:hypothetical protein